MKAFRRASRSRPGLSKSRIGSKRPSPRARLDVVEALEDRRLLSTFTVTNLHNNGDGSLRWAMVAANSQPGPDTIAFGVAGTIKVANKALPAITDTVTIDGSSAPGYAGRPVVTVNFRGTRGINFANGSDGSTLRALSVINAANVGVTLNASHITVQGNYIGLKADGKTAAGNRGDGVRINASSHDNLIGNADPVSSIRYYTANGVSMQPVSGWQGIRDGDTAGEYILTGTSNNNGLLYIGPISGIGGKSYSVNYPGAASTSVYGPDNLGNGLLRLVGSYKDGDGHVHGFVFEGTTADLSKAAHYKTVDFPDSHITYVHSTMGGLAVGNADAPEGAPTIITGHAFLYDLATDHFLPGLAYPGATTTSAYGIWYNGGTSYTITGGYTNIQPGDTDSHGYLVDYDSATGQFSHWTSLDVPHPAGERVFTHVEGISSDQKGVYTLSADGVGVGSTDAGSGFLATVRRNTDGSFGPTAWVPLRYPGTSGITSANSVAGNQVVGIVIGSSTFSYQSTVNYGFQLSNVISGNGGNGVTIAGAHDNVISMNNIGTDATGTLKRGNARNGILVTQGAMRNMIGGQSTGNGNDPTAGVFARPPQGNLISGNKQDGVLINQGATQNVLSGNFIGTAASGNSALGNGQDGVAIVGANGNQLLGCTFQQDPFVFYNVISGNGRNGVRVSNSNDTVIQANFMGVGANNATVVANKGDGLLVAGSSANTQVGGVIPLGNVISGNDQNGIEVKGTASGLVSFNTFAGLFAFGAAAPNKQNGILITSTGGNNLIRTCIVSGNLGNGIEIGGNATGVQVTDTSAGTNTNISTALPNGKSGILITGGAHGNAVGGFQPSVEVRVTSSANLRYGIEVAGSAHDNVIFGTRIGTDFFGTGNLGNTFGGIYLGPGTSSTTIGGASAPYTNLIRFNIGNGVTIQSSRDALIEGNGIVDNQGYGLRATGDASGSVVRNNQIAGNSEGNVNLDGSTGITYIP